LQRGQAGSTGSARRIILKGLVTVGSNIIKSRDRDDGLELGPGRDVHTAVGDPASVEAARRADIEIGKESIDEDLVSAPA